MFIIFPDVWLTWSTSTKGRRKECKNCRHTVRKRGGKMGATQNGFGRIAHWQQGYRARYLGACVLLAVHLSLPETFLGYSSRNIGWDWVLRSLEWRACFSLWCVWIPLQKGPWPPKARLTDLLTNLPGCLVFLNVHTASSLQIQTARLLTRLRNKVFYLNKFIIKNYKWNTKHQVGTHFLWYLSPWEPC